MIRSGFSCPRDPDPGHLHLARQPAPISVPFYVLAYHGGPDSEEGHGVDGGSSFLHHNGRYDQARAQDYKQVDAI